MYEVVVRLRYVLICFPAVVQSLHILLLYQCLYGPLDHVHIGDELGLHLTDSLQCNARREREREREGEGKGERNQCQLC